MIARADDVSDSGRCCPQTPQIKSEPPLLYFPVSANITAQCEQGHQKPTPSSSAQSVLRSGHAQSPFLSHPSRCLWPLWPGCCLPSLFLGPLLQPRPPLFPGRQSTCCAPASAVSSLLTKCVCRLKMDQQTDLPSAGSWVLTPFPTHSGPGQAPLFFRQRLSVF